MHEKKMADERANAHQPRTASVPGEGTSAEKGVSSPNESVKPERFRAVTRHGEVDVNGYRIDEFFALTENVENDGVFDIVTHIKTGMVANPEVRAPSLVAAREFVRRLRALPISWHRGFKDIATDLHKLSDVERKQAYAALRPVFRGLK